jgi:hypothetical protein
MPNVQETQVSDLAYYGGCFLGDSGSRMDTAAEFEWACFANNGCCRVRIGSLTWSNLRAGLRRLNSIDLEIVVLIDHRCHVRQASILLVTQTLLALAPEILGWRSSVGMPFDRPCALALQTANSVGKVIDLLVLT